MTVLRGKGVGDTDVVVRQAGQLCEGPIWDARVERLLWVDIPLGLVHRTDVATGEDAVVADLGQPVGCLALRGSGGCVVATERGVSVVDADWRAVEEIAELPGQPPATRTNDGACDPWGSFWVGTLAHDERPGAGSLYRLAPDRVVTQVLDGLGVSNGIDWSPDRAAMYYVDSATGRVDVLDADPADGHVSARRPLAEIELAGAVPDGLTVDAEGFLWVALWGGGRVQRYTPDGRLDREVPLPTDQVTSVAFGGPSLDALYVTTARAGLDAAALERQPLAGSVFVHDPGVRGRAPNAWAG
jgi:sugar lactone lactonase YvrE